mgnify:FL=1
MFKYMNDSIEKGLKPVTKKDLEQKFVDLGIQRGDIVLIHASLSSMGYVIGGPESIYNALKSVVGEEGTIVVPSQTVEISDPVNWHYPPVPVEWHDSIREDLPAYNKKLSFSKSMGSFSNFIGILPQAIRGEHPMYSFTAIGHRAAEIAPNEGFDFPFGEQSPLGKMYALKAKILMIGTNFETNTSLHLAENRLNREVLIERSKITTTDGEEWIEFKNVDLDSYDDYLEIQKEFMKAHHVGKETLNGAELLLIDMVECVDFTRYYYIKKNLK